MRLWRVAGKDGKGFYYTEVSGGVTMSTAVSESIGRDISTITNQHPRPEDDGIGFVTSNHLFAFTSLDQLYRWFDPEMFSASCKHGALLEVWEVKSDDVMEGFKQACFDKTQAKRVSVSKLEKFKNIRR